MGTSMLSYFTNIMQTSLMSYICPQHSTLEDDLYHAHFLCGCKIALFVFPFQ